jgi:transposase-like protein/IS1 family transposase
MITFTSEIRANCPHERAKKFGKSDSGAQRYRCLDCGKSWTDSTRQLDGMRLPMDKVEQIIQFTMEGMGIRATCRMAGVAKNTVLDLLTLIGTRCKRFSEATIVDVPVKDVQADELWSFVYCKDRARQRLSLPCAMFGDQYCFVGTERHSRFVLAWHLGERTTPQGWRFCKKLAKACWTSPYQLTTDGWMPYRHLIPNQMRHVDYALFMKIYRTAHGEGRYSPGKIIEIKTKLVSGSPDPERMCTSHVERGNLSIRMGLRRFTRLTNGFSRKWENHEAALGLFFAYRNWVRRHGTLKTTPVVVAGLADRQWTVRELIENTASYAEAA